MSSLLAIDIGAGTQDILLYDPANSIENCVQLVLPSRTKIVEERIKKATVQRENVFLRGNLMGGGPCVRAIKNHLNQGLKVAATQLAARTVRDDLERVKSMGVIIIDEKPEGFIEIETGDVDRESLSEFLLKFDVEMPDSFAVAVQDHGESPPGQSNRRFRFELWKEFIESGGMMKDLGYIDPPRYLTRMKAVQRDLPGALVTDTGSAAIWGALCDPEVEEKSRDGVVVVNMGNQHVLGVLVSNFKILGIFEHHTAKVDVSKLRSLVGGLKAGTLTNDEIFDDHGHGCHISSDHRPGTGYDFVTVVGPNREIARPLGVHFASPYGNMMLTGCFGLLRLFSIFDNKMPKT